MSETFDSVWDALFEDPGEIAVHKAKSKLMSRLEDYIKTNGLSQQEAADQMGIDQPRVSNIVNGRISKFSIDALVEFSAKVGIDASITFSDEQPPQPEQVNWAAVMAPTMNEGYSDDYQVQNIVNETIGNREMTYERELAA